MSRAAGTLITTNNATYISPRFMPGYRGHCPTVKYDFGETYGNATQKYFQDYRSEVLNSSKDPYCRGGQFPTYYTHNPDLVISNRSRNRDRWLLAPKYELSNVDHDRRDELRRFDELSQKHREYYTDKTGTQKPVNYFQLPNSPNDDFNTKVAFLAESSDFHLPPLETSRPQITTKSQPRTSNRDREMRDFIFEER
ncbi:hypothetical protein SNE40_012025 [Patella caerulea]|uniref:Ciliary microtubule inner protein 2C n=1 Tax=Patella caerulea TaxID=87958 RepID=A0AAN8PQ33_PATCE